MSYSFATLTKPERHVILALLPYPDGATLWQIEQDGATPTKPIIAKLERLRYIQRTHIDGVDVLTSRDEAWRWVREAATYGIRVRDRKEQQLWRHIAAIDKGNGHLATAYRSEHEQPLQLRP